MDRLGDLEAQSIFIFREAFARLKRLALLWSLGKDSNVMIWLARNGRRYRSLGDADITFPVASQAATIDEIIEELDATKVPERSGRAMDHEAEDAFERLRVSGYL